MTLAAAMAAGREAGLLPEANGDVRHHPRPVRLAFFLARLYGHPANAGHHIEVCRKTTVGWERGWQHLQVPEPPWPQDVVEAAVDLLIGVGETHDCYVGVLPRAQPSSLGRDVQVACCLWADCDLKSGEAVPRLRAFRPRPSMVVDSGGGRHAYWLLEQPLDPHEAQLLNARIAHALSSDRVGDPQRVLRPPATFNHKPCYPRPRPVDLVYVNPGQAWAPVEALRALPDPPDPPRPPVPPSPIGDRDDPLKAIPAPVYVPALAGREMGRDRKVRCPFHGGGRERTPSLHVYDDGWKCWSCDRAGGIYQLADLADGGDGQPRGERFLELQRRLDDLFSVRRTPKSAAAGARR